MGQKSSKKTDLYVTSEVTHCKLPADDVEKFAGRAREYTAIDVAVLKPNLKDQTKEKNGDQGGKKKSPVHEDPSSIIQLLARAHRKSYKLAFVVPKVKGSKSSLSRNSLVGEESPEKSNDKDNAGELTHTVFLWRPKVKSRVKKEQSLKKMEAKKTFLNLMMDIQSKWIFSVKEFECDTSKIESGEYVSRLQEMISVEATKGGRLLSVMRADHDLVRENGVSNGDSDGSSPKAMPKKLTLRMVFIHRNSTNASQRFIYNVKCVGITCTEEKIKVKKKQKTKLPRETNITWSENWLDLFEEDSRITEVINVGELNAPDPEGDGKGKKKQKKREFQVTTLCFHEKPVAKDKNDNNDVTNEDNGDDDDDDMTEQPMKFESLVREVWAPIDDSVQQSLEGEAEKFGANGWELCTVLVTSHVRMKSDGSEFRKCAIFFQRPKAEYVPENEKDRSMENLIQDGNVEVEQAAEPETEMLEEKQVPPTSPKDKVEKFGYALMPQVNLNEAKLRAPKPSPQKNKANDAVISGITAVQLKKVNREETKTPAEKKEDEKPPMMPQFKLRKTEINVEKKKEPESEQQNVPWMNTLERKRYPKDKPKTPEPARKSPEGGSDEIAQKLDEIKEKRAQRQKRVSIHKEEEKRKSLQEEEKRKSLLEQEEKRKSLERETKRDSVKEDTKGEMVAAATGEVIAVAALTKDEEAQSLSTSEDPLPPPLEETPKPVVDDLPPPVSDDLPEAPPPEGDKDPELPPPVAEDKVDDLPPPVVDQLPDAPPLGGVQDEELPAPIVEELPPPEEYLEKEENKQDQELPDPLEEAPVTAPVPEELPLPVVDAAPVVDQVPEDVPPPVVEEPVAPVPDVEEQEVTAAVETPEGEVVSKRDSTFDELEDALASFEVELDATIPSPEETKQEPVDPPTIPKDETPEQKEVEETPQSTAEVLPPPLKEVPKEDSFPPAEEMHPPPGEEQEETTPATSEDVSLSPAPVNKDIPPPNPQGVEDTMPEPPPEDLPPPLEDPKQEDSSENKDEQLPALEDLPPPLQEDVALPPTNYDEEAPTSPRDKTALEALHLPSPPPPDDGDTPSPLADLPPPIEDLP